MTIHWQSELYTHSQVTKGLEERGCLRGDNERQIDLPGMTGSRKCGHGS